MRYMRLLYIADARSPITLNWIRYFIERGDEVHLVSSFPCEPPAGLAGFQTLPVAFSSAKRSSAGSASAWITRSTEARRCSAPLAWWWLGTGARR